MDNQTQNNHIKYTQNFLKDVQLVEKIVSLADIKAGDIVLEIGPGKGIITKVLAEKVTESGQVIAVELDQTFATQLTSDFASLTQIKIVNSDIREFAFDSLDSNYKVFSNVPFNITSELLELLLNPQTGATNAHLILQTDSLIDINKYGAVGETFKSLLIKPLYDIKLVHKFVSTDFSPEPGIETGLFAFSKYEKPLIDAELYDLYKDFLAFVSKDRVGEGVWLRLFTKNQINVLANTSLLINGRGIKSQSISGILEAFKTFNTPGTDKHEIIQGSMQKLREEQRRKESIDRAGNHHRSQSPRYTRGKRGKRR
jgi:23S rRNA (adenine-N6)-dimethyltransferase